MKIYAEITSPLNPQEPARIVWPDSCWLLSDRPLYIPDFAPEFTAVTAMAGKIGRLGKCIAPRFAHRYVAQWTAALIIIPRPLCDRIIKGESPQSADLCFDNALVLGDWMPEPPQRLCINFQSPDGPEAADSVAYDSDPVFSALVNLSARNTLKMGDVIIAANPDTFRAFAVQEGASLTIGTSDDISATTVLSTRFK